MLEIVCAAVAAGAGFLLGKLSRPGRPRVKFPCPWELCGYPLSETPLVISPETSKHYATYGQEQCPGCDRTVLWDEFNDVYVRYRPK